MTGSRMRPVILITGLLLGLLAVTLQGVQGEELEKIPSEDQCRPYIEKALKDLGTDGSQEEGDGSEGHGVADDDDDDRGPGQEDTDTTEQDEQSGSREKREVLANDEEGDEKDDDNDDDGDDTAENEGNQDQGDTAEVTSTENADQDDTGTVEVVNGDDTGDSKEGEGDTKEDEEGDSKEQIGDDDKTGEAADTESDSAENKSDVEDAVVADGDSVEQKDDGSDENDGDTKEDDGDGDGMTEEDDDKKSGEDDGTEEAQTGSVEDTKDDDDSKEGDGGASGEDDAKSVEEEIIVAEDAGASVEQEPESTEASKEAKDTQEDDGKSGEDSKADDDSQKSGEAEADTKEEDSKERDAKDDTKEDDKDGDSKEGDADGDTKEDDGESKEKETEETDEADSKEGEAGAVSTEGKDDGESKEGEADGDTKEDDESRPEEEELIMEIEIPEILRPRDHINQLLKLDEENEVKEKAIEKVSEVVLKDLKRLYDNAIKPLETLYKYRDLSNRHFGDPEIFSKPLVLFMGPWSGGKSSIINYLLDIEYKPTSLRTGAEPSPAYFNILMHGEEEEILDGTQLAADWTFSGLQKFGQGLLDRLKGYKLNNKLLEKVNIVEIPGILEIRKQVQRMFPFNDACQWFIDRADIIFLVYDPSKLDVGPETEAILDQLKGREYQTRIILNKADQVKPEELMRVQGALIWNISPLMSSAEPPVMYSTSLWSIPYEAGAPTRLLYAQERAFLRDLRSAVDKRVEHKIASARRFAVRVRNHAKMVDCYLTTYYNHKSFFSKKKDISDRIIENPQDYHIYEGLSTLTNISRYDLPDPDVYRDFFRLNSLYDFPLLSSTCTYFRGCPINRLDVAIAYDLPELVGKYKKSIEAALHQEEEVPPPAAPTPQAQTQQKPPARSGASKMTMS